MVVEDDEGLKDKWTTDEEEGDVVEATGCDEGCMASADSWLGTEEIETDEEQVVGGIKEGIWCDCSECCGGEVGGDNGE